MLFFLCNGPSSAYPAGENTESATQSKGHVEVDPRVTPAGAGPARDGALARIALRFTQWAETWFPDAYVFAALALVVVAAAALGNGASPAAVTRAFGDGFWSLIL